jgi:hypothetical protein
MKKYIDGKPVFGPQLPPKVKKESAQEKGSQKKFLNFTPKEFKRILPLVEKMISEAGGIENFLKKNKEFAVEWKEIAENQKSKVAKWASMYFPEMKEDEILNSYKKQIKIYDQLIEEDKKLTQKKEAGVSNSDSLSTAVIENKNPNEDEPNVPVIGEEGDS